MRLSLFIIAIITCLAGYSQKPDLKESFQFRKYKSENPEKVINLAVKGDLSKIQSSADIHYKYSNNNWHFIRCTSVQASELLQSGSIYQIYFTPPAGRTLNDTMRIVQNVDSVHMGESPLPGSYTGKDVIVGYVDTGLDWTHDDFKNADGSTRVLYYWDQTLPVDPLLTPGKYGYGQVWDSAAINLGTITSMDNSAHGTTVSGTGSGNGLADGTNKGVAPESDIIIIESDFAAPNWALTVADGIDFVFSMADTLGKPAVVNTSVGEYLGSHDGSDPAGQYVDSLLNDMPGRIVVAAAGNSGAQGKYHVNGIVTADTSMVWLDVNPGAGGYVAFDLWADTADLNNVYFAMGADNDSPFDFRGRTAFYNILDIVGGSTIDSIMNAGNKLAEVDFFCEEVNGVYHILGLLNNPDSLDYLYRFETYGSGEYDLWAGSWQGYSEIIHTGLPSIGSFPDVEFYQYPDTLQTIVSSWTCLPSVVTVGNVQTQWDYIDYSSMPYSSGVVPGILSVNSSKGPNRLGVVKPDVCATGDLTLSSCPGWLASSLQVSNPDMMSEGGYHVRNGGTSMASPVIAGIAALYLEKCPNSTYQDFLDDLHLLAFEDGFTGPTPNMGYGHGKVDAFEVLVNTNVDVVLVGDSIICSDPEVYTAEIGPFSDYLWHTGETTSSITLTEADTVSVVVTNSQGCTAWSDSLEVIQGEIPDFPFVNEIGGGLITVPADSFQWYYNGTPIDGSNSQYLDPDTTGTYTVEVFSEDGCSLLSDPVDIDYSQIEELSKNEFVILPNPFINEFSIIKSDFYDVDLVLTDIRGRIVYQHSDIASDDLFIKVSVPQLENGVYLLSLYFDDNHKTYRMIKQ